MAKFRFSPSKYFLRLTLLASTLQRQHTGTTGTKCITHTSVWQGRTCRNGMWATLTVTMPHYCQCHLAHHLANLYHSVRLSWMFSRSFPFVGFSHSGRPLYQCFWKSHMYSNPSPTNSCLAFVHMTIPVWLKGTLLELFENTKCITWRKLQSMFRVPLSSILQALQMS